MDDQHVLRIRCIRPGNPGILRQLRQSLHQVYGGKLLQDQGVLPEDGPQRRGRDDQRALAGVGTAKTVAAVHQGGKGGLPALKHQLDLCLPLPVPALACMGKELQQPVAEEKDSQKLSQGEKPVASRGGY